MNKGKRKINKGKMGDFLTLLKSRAAAAVIAAAAAAVIAAGPAASAVQAAVPSGLVQERERSCAAARSHRERDSETEDSFYLLPDSNTYYISESDVSWMDDEELLIARNEFYARRGRKFVTAFLREYFNSQGWYVGYIEPDDFPSDIFNRYEQANVDFIVKYEKMRSEKKEEERRRRREEKKGKREASALYDSNPTGEDSVAYGELVRDYRKALRKLFAEGGDFKKRGVNVLASKLDSPEEIGYAYRDLNGDGSEELLIGPMDAKLYGTGAVFDVYTLENDRPSKVVSSEEDSLYYVCDDGMICGEKQFDDGSWEVRYFNLADGALELETALVMDEGRNREEPWFVVGDADGASEDILTSEGEDAAELAQSPGEAVDGTEGTGLAQSPGEALEMDDPEDSIEETFGSEVLEPISYEEASDLRASHTVTSLKLLPFD